jgi:hypothetical protein
MKPRPLVPCPLYCLRIMRHLMLLIDGPSFDSPDWWEILHYWYSKAPANFSSVKLHT